jgi:hypothetical protein
MHTTVMDVVLAKETKMESVLSRMDSSIVRGTAGEPLMLHAGEGLPACR